MSLRILLVIQVKRVIRKSMDKKTDKFHAIKLFIALCGIVSCVLMFSGCGLIHKKGIPEQIEELLTDKYGQEFLVQSVEKESGMTAFDAPAYHAVVVLKDDHIAFDAYVDIKVTKSRDSYAKLLYDDEIHEKMDALLETAEGLNGYSYWVRYFMEERVWSETDTVEAYLKGSESWVNIDLKPIDDTTEAVAEHVYGLAELLKDKGIPFSICYDHHGENMYLTDDNSTELISFDDFLQRLRRRDGSE